MTQPGDRRRFPYFAKRNQIPFEIANPSKEYNIILLTAPSNLTQWLSYKKKYPYTRFLFEMVDSLVFPSNLLMKIGKGPGRYFLGKENNLIFDYQEVLHRWIDLADGVICSNKSLQEYVKIRNNNVFLSPDYLESEYNIRKVDYSMSGKIKLVWEGLPSVLVHFLRFKKLLTELNSFCELHVISAARYPVIPYLLHRSAEQYIKQLPIHTFFYPWDIQTHSQILSSCDVGIIPINREHIFAWNKPANKLVSFWFTGLPTLVSNTHAYVDMMDQAGNQMYCASEEDWVKKLQELFDMGTKRRKEIADANFAFAKLNYSDSKLDKIWNNIFESID